MGICRYCQTFVPDFAPPRLTHQDEWRKRDSHLCHQGETDQSPILAYPEPTRPIILDTDTFNLGICAVLSQDFNREERVIAYASRMLGKADKPYCIAHQELLTLVHFSKQYCLHLSGAWYPFQTSHCVLKWRKNRKDSWPGGWRRWSSSTMSCNTTQDQAREC